MDIRSVKGKDRHSDSPVASTENRGGISAAIGSDGRHSDDLSAPVHTTVHFWPNTTRHVRRPPLRSCLTSNTYILYNAALCIGWCTLLTLWRYVSIALSHWYDDPLLTVKGVVSIVWVGVSVCCGYTWGHWPRYKETHCVSDYISTTDNMIHFQVTRVLAIKDLRNQIKGISKNHNS